MAHITGHVRITAPAEQVFDAVADTRNEPSFNPAMAGVEDILPERTPDDGCPSKRGPSDATEF